MQFTMPVEVDWSKNDTELIGRFWEQHPAEQMKAAEISDRILVYHRGIDTVRSFLEPLEQTACRFVHAALHNPTVGDHHIIFAGISLNQCMMAITHTNLEVQLRTCVPHTHL
jgi:hypothetical protein